MKIYPHLITQFLDEKVCNYKKAVTIALDDWRYFLKLYGDTTYLEGEQKRIIYQQIKKTSSRYYKINRCLKKKEHNRECFLLDKICKKRSCTLISINIPIFLKHFEKSTMQIFENVENLILFLL